MLSRCFTLLSILCGVSLLLNAVQAATSVDGTRLGNSTIERTVQLRTHSWWDFGADSYVNTNKHIRLTRGVPSQMGWLWSRLPLSATNYVIEVEFKISGESTHLFGDGMAIWLTTERTQPGQSSETKVNKFNGLGIFLDTYANSRHSYSFPRVSSTLGDGNTHYDYDNDGDEQSIGDCSANYRRTNVATKLKISYVKDKFLDVKIQYKAWDDWTDCFYIEKISLPTAPFLGFSAITGDVADAHDHHYSAILSAPDAPRDKIKPNLFSLGSSESSGTWLGFFFKLFAFAGLCVGGYYGYLEYLRRQRYAGAGNFGMGGRGGGGGFGGMYSNNKRF
ncbi:legume-like lectin family-domain-containing protein [Infundibulicybe gibba]|nr:legume-like lectin family-domain-containing protein [Infundibulicybe gibba]